MKLLLFLGVIISVIVALIIQSDLLSNFLSGYIKWKESNWTHSDKLKIIKVWENVVHLPKKRFQNVVIGMNSNLDLIVPALPLMSTLGASEPSAAMIRDLDSLDSLDDISASLAYFLQRGYAAERTMTNKTLFHEIVSVAANLKGSQKFIGGNAALMAQVMTQLFGEEIRVSLVGPVGPQLIGLLDTRIHVPESCHDEVDEVHLILEYPSGSSWGPGGQCPVSNRFIFSHDLANTQLQKLAAFLDHIVTKGADLVVLSGLHLCEALTDAQWRSQITRLVAGLSQRSSDVRVHLELASMTNELRMRDVAKHIFPKIDSLGLNEQELTFLSNSYAGPTIDDPRNDVSGTIDIVSWILANQTMTRFRRVHFHSQAFHLIGIRTLKDSAADSASLSSLATSVSAGARLAGVRACDLKSPSAALMDIKMTFGPLNLGSNGPRVLYPPSDEAFGLSPILQWTADCLDCKEDNVELRFALSPVLVCKHPKRTVGLGDSISAGGLLYTASDF